MADNSKKTAVEVAKELGEAMRKELLLFKSANVKVPAKVAVLQVADSIRKQITDYKDELVKLRKMESSDLIKAEKMGWVDHGMVDDRYKEHASDTHPYEIHHDTKHGTGPKKFALRHQDQGHVSWHKTLGEAKSAAKAHAASGMAKDDDMSMGDDGADLAMSAKPLEKAPTVSSKPTQSDEELVHDMSKKTTIFDKIKCAPAAPKQNIFDKIKKCGEMAVVKSDAPPPTPPSLNGGNTMGNLAHSEKSLTQKSDKILDPGKFDDDNGDNVGGYAKPTRKLQIPAPDTEHSDPEVPGAVLPSDKASVSADTEKQGSGGQLRKGKKLSKSDNIFSKVKGKKSPPLDKAMPKLGGKDMDSKTMTTHAMADGSLAAQKKNAVMPTGQQMKAPQMPKMPKLPTMEEHSARQSQFADFMPSGGKFK